MRITRLVYDRGKGEKADWEPLRVGREEKGGGVDGTGGRVQV